MIVIVIEAFVVNTTTAMAVVIDLHLNLNPITQELIFERK